MSQLHPGTSRSNGKATEVGRTVVTLAIEHRCPLPASLVERIKRAVYDICATGGDQPEVTAGVMEIK